MKIRSDFRHTRIASYIGYITQAVVNNFAPLLFLTFSAQFSLSLSAITLLITVNFCTQLIVDLLAARFVDKIGYRTSVVFAHICAAGGLSLSLRLRGFVSLGHSVRSRRRSD